MGYLALMISIHALLPGLDGELQVASGSFDRVVLPRFTPVGWIWPRIPYNGTVPDCRRRTSLDRLPGTIMWETTMPNIGTVLKQEILRLARKEVRATVNPLKKRVADLTRSNASLKKKVPQLEKIVVRLQSEAEARMLQSVQAGEKKLRGSRLGPRSIQAQRKRLKLTRAEFGRLAEVSANTIYLWETGQITPREKSRSVLVGFRKLGMKEARRLLQTADKSRVPKETRKRRKRK